MSRRIIAFLVLLVLVTGIASVHPALGQEEPVRGYTYRWGDLADGGHIEPDTDSGGHDASLSAYVGGDFTEVGEERFLTIMCEVKGIQPFRQYDETFFRGQYPVLQEYWSTSSYGLLNLTGEAVGWFTLPKSQSEYADGRHGWGNTGYTFARDCTAAAREAGVNLEAYTGFNLVTNAFNGYPAFGGFYCPDRCWRTTWLTPWAWRDASTIAHEMGHTFGWPHSGSPEGHAYQNPFDVMSDTYLCKEVDAVYGCMPQHTLALNRYRAGWIPEARRERVLSGTSVTTFTLDVATAPATEELPLFIDGVSWYSDYDQPVSYTIEVREHLDMYDGQLPETGVVVHEYRNSRSPNGRLLRTFGSSRLSGVPGDVYYNPGIFEICVLDRADNGAITVVVANEGQRCGNSTQVFLGQVSR